jgi:hypothetical protein
VTNSGKLSRTAALRRAWGQSGIVGPALSSSLLHAAAPLPRKERRVQATGDCDSRSGGSAAIIDAGDGGSGGEHAAVLMGNFSGSAAASTAAGTAAPVVVVAAAVPQLLVLLLDRARCACTAARRSSVWSKHELPEGRRGDESTLAAVAPTAVLAKGESKLLGVPSAAGPG